ncbi:MAG TPA: VWA domain-containing protein [Thermoplasmata archaeon]|nr:VWA domain-containing protein [Thermoplasmata archaeon]
MTAPPAEAAVPLPDCSHVVEDVESDDLLSVIDSALVIEALAEHGPGGVQNLVDRQAGENSELARRIARLRELLKRQASSRVSRILEEYDRRSHELELDRAARADELDREMEALEARLAAARQIHLGSLLDGALLDEVQQALLLPTASWMQPLPGPTLWERIRAFFARIAAFFRGLFHRGSRSESTRRTERTVPIATLLPVGRALTPSELSEAMARLTPRQHEELESSVTRDLSERERSLAREAEAKRKEAEAQRRGLEEERREAERRAQREADQWARQAEEERLRRELSERGLVNEKGGQLTITYSLVERFAKLVLEAESRSLPGDVRMSLKGGASTGVYEKARLRIPDEVAHLDIPSSILAARQAGSRHIEESTSYVFREILAERVHVVLALDKSGSMGEGEKLPAAKKALLALYVAIRRRHPDATIDVVAFDNEVRLLDLVQLWETPPGSFTNTGEALRTAFLLLRASRANRKELFLVTDGLPESYTDPDGRIKSGNLDKAMEYALGRALELTSVKPLRFTMVLIKSQNPDYEKAARLLTHHLNGELVVTEPQRLGIELLVRWASGQEQTRRTPAEPGPAPARTPPAPGPKGAKRRRRDRRMGG